MFSLLAWSIQASTLCKSNNNLYIANTEYVSKDGKKKLLFVGMRHIGPQKYYLDQQDTIKNWIQKDKAIILTEFFTCSGDSSMIAPAQISNEFLTFIKTSPFDKTQQQIDKFTAGKKASCKPDSNGIKRPSYLVEKKERECERQKKTAFPCQDENFKLPFGPNITVKTGDFEMDKAPASIQMFGSLYYGNEKLFPDLNPTQKKDLQSLLNEFILARRDRQLFEKIIKEFEHTNKVVVPWGLNHQKELNEMLLSKEFKALPGQYVKYKDGPIPLDIAKDIPQCPENETIPQGSELQITARSCGFPQLDTHRQQRLNNFFATARWQNM